MSDVFSDRLKAARELRELSQGDLAVKANLPPTSISHFESGSRKPSFDNLRRLAVALEVSTDYLMGLVDDTQISTETDPLYRDGQNLSARDRTVAAEFMRILANLQKDSSKDK